MQKTNQQQIKENWSFQQTTHSISKTVWKVKVAQSCPTLYEPIYCSPPGSSARREAQKLSNWLQFFGEN